MQIRQWLQKRALRKQFERRGLMTWPASDGFGITTSWPNDWFEEELKLIRMLAAETLPAGWELTGPTFAAGGAFVMYLFPKHEMREVRA